MTGCPVSLCAAAAAVEVVYAAAQAGLLKCIVMHFFQALALLAAIAFLVHDSCGTLQYREAKVPVHHLVYRVQLAITAHLFATGFPAVVH